MARKGVNAQKPDRGDGVHRNSYPHAVHGGELHGYVEVLVVLPTNLDSQGLVL